MILNPYIYCDFVLDAEGKEALKIYAPKKNTAAQLTEFRREEHQELYDLFFELQETSFNFLDVDEDLTAEQQELLARHNVLLEPEEVSGAVLFACQLHEITAESEELSATAADLIVNPNFVFEEAKDFDALMARRIYAMLTVSGIGWVTDAGTGIRLGYWLNDEFDNLLRNFKAGESPRIDLTAEQIKILRAAKILVEPDYIEKREREWQRQIEQAADEIQTNRYTALQGILPPEQIAAIHNYFDNLRREGFMRFNDTQVKRRYALHNDLLSRYLHQQLAPLVSRVARETVKPSYAYSATYIEDAELEPHTDRPQCEFTMSMQIGYKPELKTGELSPWALSLDDLNEKKIDYHLACGDGVIYKGCELVHYRAPLFAGHESTSVFFHFVHEGFEGALD